MNETEKLNNLPKITQLVKDKARILLLEVRHQRLHSFLGKKLDVVSRRAGATEVLE